ncbi:mitochondrial inner membrane protein OXA1L [Chelonus insularis]|uniref:mitochondrial inner membrane protein OXA1L n=1 Tax=Chelonus insularis TaxID=460826 RepID=UPI001589E3F4|nr:mitochondrial inner membrane protein OXA1L [Chelonus insularis]
MMVSRVSLCFNNQLLSRTCPFAQKTLRKSLHISCYNKRNPIATSRYSISNRLTRYSPVFSSSFIRSISTNETNVQNVSEEMVDTAASTAAASESLLDKIPDIPVTPPPAAEVEEVIVHLTNKLGEPTFASLGLGSWYPSGIVQQMLEFIHVTGDLPWWASITIGTIVIRTLVFPLVIYSQRQTVHMHNVLPEMQKIQADLTEARMCGDQLAAARHTFELMEFMKDKKCNPIKNLIAPFFQFPIFASFFFGLKKMANLPVESMQTGGLWWFKDLTVSDPYFLLPLMTSGTLFLTIKAGVDTPSLEAIGMMKYVILAVPVIILPFTINFSSAISWYWLSTNIYSLIQVLILRIPAVRVFFKIPVKIQHKPGALIKKPFKQGFKDSIHNMKMARELGDRAQLDAIQFNKAGRGPTQKTYKYNPIVEHIKKVQAVKKN